MISVLFCSRVKDNPDSNLKLLLDSAVEHTLPQERANIEFLIKYDDDDDQRPPDSFFAQYPFSIRTFAWSRGEGRHYLHHAQEYLFAQRDPRSRFCLMTADDFYFTRSGFVSEILSIKDEFCILGHNRPPIESFAGVYEDDAQIRKWAISFGCWSPVVSARLFEVCQNFGWQSNVDGWLMGLSVVLYDLYKIVLWRTHEPFYARGGGYGLGDTPTYNNLELTGQKGPFNKYWFEMLRRQARNLYLNIEHGTDFHRTAWTAAPRRLWTKFRAQPLQRLPIRVYHKLWRVMGEAFAERPAEPAPAGPSTASARGEHGSRPGAVGAATTASAPWGDPAEWSDGIPPEIHPADAETLTLLLNKVKRPGMVVLEVGSWVGNGSTKVIAEAIRDVGGTLYCVDTWAGSDNVEHHQRFRARYNSMFTVFSENVKRYGAQHIVKPLVMSSLEASRMFPDDGIDLVFIDGNHGYSHVKQDVLAWLPKVKAGGVLCGHDCDASYADLDAALRSEMEKHGEEDVLHNPYTQGPPALHAGVVTAVHEIFGGKAHLWIKVKPTTIWSYEKPQGLIGQLRALVGKHAARLRRQGLDSRLQVAPTPWPEGRGDPAPTAVLP